MTSFFKSDTHETADTILFESLKNPKPEAVRAGYLTTKDYKKLRYAVFAKHPQNKCGTIILLHGRNESIEKYYETIDDLQKRGFHVATLDWRGQGRSDRLIKDKYRGFVRRFNDYTDDLELFINSVVRPECPHPYYILAHSAGGLITLASMPRLIPHIERIVLAAPLLGFNDKRLSETKLRHFCGFMHLSGLGKIYARRGVKPGENKSFTNNLLTSDEQRFQRNQQIIYDHPALGLSGPTFSWIFNALRAIHQLNKPKNIAALKIPTLFVLAGGDKVVSSKDAENYARKTRGAVFITIDGARHELMQEDDHYRQQFWAAFDAFIPAQKEPVDI